MESEYDDIIKLGFDAVNSCGILNFKNKPRGIAKLRFVLDDYKRVLLNTPSVYQYKDVSPFFVNGEYDIREDILPTIIPNWDHSPRSGANGYLFDNSTPEFFYSHLMNVKALLNRKDNNLCFLKSWNEWGEGNYVEPDLKFGWGYLDALKEFCKKI